MKKHYVVTEQLGWSQTAPIHVNHAVFTNFEKTLAFVRKEFGHNFSAAEFEQLAHGEPVRKDGNILQIETCEAAVQHEHVLNY